MAKRKSVTIRWDKEVLKRTDSAVEKSPRKTDRTRFMHEALIDKLVNEGEVTQTESERLLRKI